MSQLHPHADDGGRFKALTAPDIASARRPDPPVRAVPSRTQAAAPRLAGANDGMGLGEAARRIGVPADVLRDLCDAGLIRFQRRRSGHRILTANDLPDREWIDDQVNRRYAQAVQAARAAARHVAVELEAITLELAEIAEDFADYPPLGEHVQQCHLPRASFTDAVWDLRAATEEATTAHRRAAAMQRLRPHCDRE